MHLLSIRVWLKLSSLHAKHLGLLFNKLIRKLLTTLLANPRAIWKALKLHRIHGFRIIYVISCWALDIILSPQLHVICLSNLSQQISTRVSWTGSHKCWKIINPRLILLSIMMESIKNFLCQTFMQMQSRGKSPRWGKRWKQKLEESIHKLTVGESSHPEIEKIEKMWEEILVKIRAAEYTGNTDTLFTGIVRS